MRNDDNHREWTENQQSGPSNSEELVEAAALDDIISHPTENVLTKVFARTVTPVDGQTIQRLDAFARTVPDRVQKKAGWFARWFSEPLTEAPLLRIALAALAPLAIVVAVVGVFSLLQPASRQGAGVSQGSQEEGSYIRLASEASETGDEALRVAHRLQEAEEPTERIFESAALSFDFSASTSFEVDVADLDYPPGRDHLAFGQALLEGSFDYGNDIPFADLDGLEMLHRPMLASQEAALTWALESLMQNSEAGGNGFMPGGITELGGGS